MKANRPSTNTKPAFVIMDVNEENSPQGTFKCRSIGEVSAMGVKRGPGVRLASRCCYGACFGLGFVITVIIFITMFWIVWCYFGLVTFQFTDTQRRALVNYSFTTSKPSPTTSVPSQPPLQSVSAHSGIQTSANKIPKQTPRSAIRADKSSINATVASSPGGKKADILSGDDERDDASISARRVPTYAAENTHEQYEADNRTRRQKPSSIPENRTRTDINPTKVNNNGRTLRPTEEPEYSKARPLRDENIPTIRDDEKRRVELDPDYDRKRPDRRYDDDEPYDDRRPPRRYDERDKVRDRDLDDDDYSRGRRRSYLDDDIREKERPDTKSRRVYDDTYPEKRRDDRYIDRDDDRYRSRDIDDDRYSSRRRDDDRYRSRIPDDDRYRSRDRDLRPIDDKYRDDDIDRDRDERRRRIDDDRYRPRDYDDDRYRDRDDKYRYRSSDDDRYRSPDDRYRDPDDRYRDDDRYRTRSRDRDDDELRPRDDRIIKDSVIDARRRDPPYDDPIDRDAYVSRDRSRARDDDYSRDREVVRSPTYDERKRIDVVATPSRYEPPSRVISEDRYRDRDLDDSERRATRYVDDERIAPTRTREMTYISRSSLVDPRPRDEGRYYDERRDSRPRDDDPYRNVRIDDSRGLSSAKPDKARRFDDDREEYRTRTPSINRDEVSLDRRSYSLDDDDDDDYRKRNYENRRNREKIPPRDEDRYIRRDEPDDDEYRRSRPKVYYDDEPSRSRNRDDTYDRDDDRYSRPRVEGDRDYDDRYPVRETDRSRRRSDDRKDDDIRSVSANDRPTRPRIDDKVIRPVDDVPYREPDTRRYEDRDGTRSSSERKEVYQDPRTPSNARKSFSDSPLSSSSRDTSRIVIREKRYQNSQNFPQSSVRDNWGSSNLDNGYSRSEDRPREPSRDFYQSPKEPKKIRSEFQDDVPAVPLTAKDVIEAAIRHPDTSNSNQNARKVYYPVFDPRVSNMTSPDIIRPSERRGTIITAKKKR